MLLSNIQKRSLWLLISWTLFSVSQVQSQDDKDTKDYLSLPNPTPSPSNPVGIQFNYALAQIDKEKNLFTSYFTVYQLSEYKSQSNKADAKWKLKFNFNDNRVKVLKQSSMAIDSVLDPANQLVDYTLTLPNAYNLDKQSFTLQLNGTYPRDGDIDGIRPINFKLMINDNNTLDLKFGSDIFYSRKQPEGISSDSNSNSNNSENNKQGAGKRQNITKTNNGSSAKASLSSDLENDPSYNADGTYLVGTPIGLIIYSCVFLIGSLSYLSGTILRLRYLTYSKTKA